MKRATRSADRDAAKNSNHPKCNDIQSFLTSRNTSKRSNHRRRRRRSSSRRYDDEDNDEPFAVLFVKVGICVLISSLILWHGLVKRLLPTVNPDDYVDDDALLEYADDDGARVESSGIRGVFSISTDPPPPPPTVKPTLEPFPIFHIDEEGSDNFGLSVLLSSLEGSNDDKHADTLAFKEVTKAASALRKEFAVRSGGENAARFILQTATSTFHLENNLIDTTEDNTLSRIPMATKQLARRLLNAKESHRPFKISFGGYSVTAGRGNLFSQSYPFVLERLLEDPIKLLGIPSFQVRNAALGGAPSFPYGWCLRNFLGSADAVSWDYSMNEAGGIAEGLEPYLRHALSMKQSPMLLVKDTNTAEPRKQMLQKYANLGFALDTLVIHTDPAFEPFLSLRDEILPLGFTDWRKFGAPPGAPGQAPHHPAAREHEFIGWIIAMHFLSAIELAAFCLNTPNGSRVCKQLMSLDVDRTFLPPPTVANDDVTVPAHVYSLFYGSPTREDDSSTWSMNNVYCHTTFEPTLSGHFSDDIIVGGTAKTEGLDIMLPKGSKFFNDGWVLDLGLSEKRAKRKLERYGGLGFVDAKKAYYGVNASGLLDLFLPLEEESRMGSSNNTSADLLSAVEDATDTREFFKALVVCEVNEKRGEHECNMKRDVAFVVGGVLVGFSDVNFIDFGSASYLGKPVCVDIRIPKGVITSKDQRGRFGLSLGISVRNRQVSIKEGACSVSHIVYEVEGARVSSL